MEVGPAEDARAKANHAAKPAEEPSSSGRKRCAGHQEFGVKTSAGGAKLVSRMAFSSTMEFRWAQGCWGVLMRTSKMMSACAVRGRDAGRSLRGLGFHSAAVR